MNGRDGLRVMSRYHKEVRKIFNSVGLEISRLKRTRFGPIFLPSKLAKGKYIELSNKDIDSIKKAYRGFFRSGENRKTAIEKIESEFPKTKVIQKILDFIKHSNRGII